MGVNIITPGAPKTPHGGSKNILFRPDNLLGLYDLRLYGADHENVFPSRDTTDRNLGDHALKRRTSSKYGTPTIGPNRVTLNPANAQSSQATNDGYMMPYTINDAAAANFALTFFFSARFPNALSFATGAYMGSGVAGVALGVGANAYQFFVNQDGAPQLSVQIPRDSYAGSGPDAFETLIGVATASQIRLYRKVPGLPLSAPVVATATLPPRGAQFARDGKQPSAFVNAGEMFGRVTVDRELTADQINARLDDIRGYGTGLSHPLLVC